MICQIIGTHTGGDFSDRYPWEGGMRAPDEEAMEVILSALRERAEAIWDSHTGVGALGARVYDESV